MVSGSVSLLSSRCFSPFPHGTGSLSVSWEYLALPDGPGRFAQNFSCSALLRIPLCPGMLRVRGSHPLWPQFPLTFHSHSRYNDTVLQPRRRIATATVWALPRSLATTGGIIHLFSLPGGTKMFQFPPFASLINSDNCLMAAGLSHSEISGSKVICTYPKLIAAYHVLHRLHEPRHPPCALVYFLSPQPNLHRHERNAHVESGRLVTHTFSCIALIIKSYDLCSTLQFRLCQYVKDRWETLNFEI